MIRRQLKYLLPGVVMIAGLFVGKSVFTGGGAAADGTEECGALGSVVTLVAAAEAGEAAGNRAQGAALAGFQLTAGDADGAAAYPLLKGGGDGWQHPRWPGAAVLVHGASMPDADGMSRRVALIQPVELPYPVRIEEWIKHADSGNEQVVDTIEMVANRLIVRPEAAQAAEIVELVETMGLTARRISATGIYRFELPDMDLDTVPHAVAALAQMDGVRYAEPDFMVHLLGEPDDPNYTNGTLWGLHNTGQDEGVEDADIDAPEGWAIRTDAANIIIGMVDTGVRHTHEDIAANMWINPGESGLDAFGNDKASNGIDDDGNGFVDDVHGINAIEMSGNPNDTHGHGSHTAGTAAAVGNNGVGVTGVAWNAKVMALKFLGGGSGSSSDAVVCIDYAIQHGAHLTSNSWGGQRLADSVKEIIEAADAAGQLFLAAAGNNSADNDIGDTFPANYPLQNIISVAAIHRKGELAGFSNFGAGKVHLAAPGQRIFSIDSLGDSSYKDLSGTSMATPMVAGLAALVIAEFPADGHMAIKNRILAGVQPTESLAATTITGGIANLHGALTRSSPTPFNDNFADAMEIIEDPQMVHANNHHATSEPGEPVPDGFGNNTVWFTFEAKVNGQTIANTSGSDFPTTVAVFTGSALESLVLVGASEEYEGTPQGRVDYQAVAGTTYHIAVAGKDNATGFIQFTLSGPPVEDFFADALPIPRFPFTYTSDNTNASREDGEPLHAGQVGGGSLWLKIRMADYGLASQDIVLSSRNSAYDTLLAVYRSDDAQPSLDNLIEVAASDDAPYGGTFSEVSFFADAQTTYYIVTDGKQNDRGLVRLLGRNQSTNDDFDAPFVVSGETVNLTIEARELRWATREPGEPNHDNDSAGTSLWYRWSPPTVGDYEIFTNSNTALGIYTGSTLTNLESQTSDQGNGSSFSRAVLRSAKPEAVYQIAVDTRSNSIQIHDVEFTIRPFTVNPHATVANAQALTGSATSELPLQRTFNNHDAQGESGETGGPPYQTVWIKWTAPDSGTYQVETRDSSVQSSFNVFTGPPDATRFNQLQAFAWQSVHMITPNQWALYEFIAGTTYYFRLGSLYQDETGDFGLRISPFNPPENDDFFQSEQLTGFFAAREIRNFGATRQSGEPTHRTDNAYFNNSDRFAGDANFAYSTLWFKWTPAGPHESRRTTASAFFSMIGTVLAVYETTASEPTFRDLTQVTPGASSMFYYWWNTGEVSWHAEVGKTYYIMLGSQSATAQGIQSFSLWQNPNDQFADRGRLPSRVPLTGYSANFAATREPFEPRIDPVEYGGRSIWYEWVAPRSGVYSLDTYGSFSTNRRPAPMQAGVYTGESISSLNKVASNARASMRDANAFLVFEATAGQAYQIVLDALDGPSSDSHKTEWVERAVIQFNINTGTVANDNFANAELIYGPSHLEFIDLKFATMEPGEPNHGDRHFRSAWWKWTAPASGTWWAATASDVFDTHDNRTPGIAVYSDSGTSQGFGRLELLDQNNNSEANSSYTPAIVSFPVTAGQTYYIAIADGGPTRNHGGFRSGLLLQQRAPNDDFEQATEITGSRRTVQGHNLGATWQSAEPQIDRWGTDSNQRSVWWKWTAPASGFTEVATHGSYIYNELGVYRGNDLVSLIEVVKQATGGAFDNGMTYDERVDLANRRVSFNASAGTTYYFMVVGSGFENASFGPIQLTVTGQPGKPFAPEHFTAHRVNASRVDFTWSDLAVDESTYVIHAAPSADGPWREVLNSGEADTVAWSDFSATTGSWYRVRAEGPGGTSEWVTRFVAGPHSPAAFASMDAWRLHFFGSSVITQESANDASPLNDGMSNLAKFAFGGGPLTPAKDLMPRLSFTTVDGKTYAVFHYRRLVGSGSGDSVSGYHINGLSYQVRTSNSSLSAWQTGAQYLTVHGAPSPNRDGTETAHLRIMAPVDDTSSIFAMVQVSIHQ